MPRLLVLLFLLLLRGPGIAPERLLVGAGRVRVAALGFLAALGGLVAAARGLRIIGGRLVVAGRPGAGALRALVILLRPALVVARRGRVIVALRGLVLARTLVPAAGRLLFVAPLGGLVVARRLGLVGRGFRL